MLDMAVSYAALYVVAFLCVIWYQANCTYLGTFDDGTRMEYLCAGK